MPSCLPPGTMPASGLPGAVSLPGRSVPFPPILSIPTVACSKSSPYVKAVIKDSEGKLTIARGERK